jgi:hypothetical protein
MNTAPAIRQLAKNQAKRLAEDIEPKETVEKALIRADKIPSELSKLERRI